MRVHELPAASRTTTLFDRAIAPLIEAVGTDAFAPRLFDVLHDAIGCVHVSAFAMGTVARSVILAENEGDVHVARELGRRYVEHYWRLDPVNVVRPEEAGRGFMLETGPKDIGHPDYRRDCYTAVDIGARVSLCETRPCGTLRLNFYARNAFRPESVRRIAQAADLLMPFLWRQGSGHFARPATAGEFEPRLRMVAPDLTDREREVCALIALGVSSEGIALRLALRLNTVLTYRKRAYKRLGISSQNELLRLICPLAPGLAPHEATGAGAVVLHRWVSPPLGSGPRPVTSARTIA